MWNTNKVSCGFNLTTACAGFGGGKDFVKVVVQILHYACVPGCKVWHRSWQVILTYEKICTTTFTKSCNKIYIMDLWSLWILQQNETMDPWSVWILLQNNTMDLWSVDFMTNFYSVSGSMISISMNYKEMKNTYTVHYVDYAKTYCK